MKQSEKIMRALSSVWESSSFTAKIGFKMTLQKCIIFPFYTNGQWKKLLKLRLGDKRYIDIEITIIYVDNDDKLWAFLL